MLEHDTKEAIENRIIIDDISVDVFQQLLAFMYTGEVIDIDENPVDLLIAANKVSLFICLSKNVLTNNFPPTSMVWIA